MKGSVTPTEWKAQRCEDVSLPYSPADSKQCCSKVPFPGLSVETQEPGRISTDHRGAEEDLEEEEGPY